MYAQEMEEALSKIRPHTSSSLAHQKIPANLLTALEETFKEQNAERTPAAYFAGLLTTLESTVQKEKETNYLLGDGDLLPAELYLLALIGPFVPAPVIRASLSNLLSLTSPLWTPLNPHAPPLRSQLTWYNAVLRALDRTQLETQAVRQTFATILQLCLDPRPKVRKRAADIVRDVLASPPSPLLRHPYSERVGEWSINALSEVNSLKQKGKKNANTDDVVNAAIHLLAFIRPVLPYLPSSSLPAITTSLLSLPRLGNPFLSQSAYGVLSDLLSIPDDPDMPRNIDTSTSDLLQAILSSPPLKTDIGLLPPWVQVVGKVMPVYASVDPEACTAELPRVWKTIFVFLESPDATTRRETAEALTRLTQCISPQFIEASLGNEKAALTQIITQLSKALDSIAFVRAIPELLNTVSALIFALRYRPSGRGSPTAAERLLMSLLRKIADMRVKKGFEHKEAADDVLQTAMTVIGPEALLAALPLNLEPDDRATGREPRAFLLPLLVQLHPSPLRHFISYFVPLTERMFDLQQRADAEDRAAEAKVWSVLVSQVWNGLPAYCHQTPDLRESLTPQFAQMLSQLLYNQPELRPPVLKALKVIVESNTRASEGTAGDDSLSTEEAEQNLAFLKSQAESWFAVLFNVFSSVGRNEHAMVGDVISAWAAITDEKAMSKTCRKVVDMFKANLVKLPKATGSGSNTHLNASEDQRSTVATMQDILVLLVPYLSQKDTRTVFELCLSPEVLKHKDNGVQKRAYKLLSKITSAGKIEIDAESLFAKMDEVAEDTLSAAKKDRLTFLKALLPALPSNALHVIPAIIPEAVLGTKEPSEKARLAAFGLIVAMAYKMKEGGVVKHAKLNGMDEDDLTEAPASLDEYLTMLAGGLAGASPHMISASVTAISRLIFEFKDDISQEMHNEIFLTFLEYLRSANREIVKSTFGFVKLFIHTRPLDSLLPHLDALVPVLLRWSHDHKNHFKEKVRHIFERLIRRCGWDAVYAAGGGGRDEEAAKVLTAIKKRKDRVKRRKAARRAAGEESDDEEAAPVRAVAEDAFEDVLYGSESDGDASDDELHANVEQKKGAKANNRGARLRVDDDEPMDLLHGASTRVTNVRKAGRKPGADVSKFKTDGNTGKMVIESDSDNDAERIDEDARMAGAAYRETLTSVDGFTRDQRGRVKFHKDTKKRRRDAEDGEENEDVEMVDVSAAVDAGKNKKAKRRKPVKVGQEFKSKRAGGDVKKGGMDPYAYLPLSQAAKVGKGKGSHKVTVTGRR
ncbi:NUC173-domain-containing protein [Fomitiporia mediterranea MF3/22]|uniref:NUC173-domain-containing protein n=1 Tax=Fomitiporia mediterranea (strain MF3/22) TaxID=694068 RepID=UPI0004409273|nr:NUC173-domain-containing protein [Fomitiporia mediterranea MF3/22]EJD03307.1 NUC173-domain-containing protein [Fomitiporia mediterranea MF3/22]